MTVTGLSPEGLLEAAHHLVPAGRGRPRAPRLRRAISTAYYAAFTALTQEVAHHYPGSAAQHAIRRLVSHHGGATASAPISGPRRRCRGCRATRLAIPTCCASQRTSSPFTPAASWPTTTTTTCARRATRRTLCHRLAERRTLWPRHARSAPNNSTSPVSRQSPTTAGAGICRSRGPGSASAPLGA